MAGQIAGLLFAEHEAQDVLRAMRQIVVGDVDDREPRFGKLGGDSVDRAGAKGVWGCTAGGQLGAVVSNDEVVLLSREK